jgi:MoaA/NifB/PqqE/SkfB family radical SAM enzyme
MISLKKIKVVAGIILKKVLTGPIEVSVDLTCRCSTGCIMCWYWSPLLKNCPSEEWINQSLDFDVFRRLIEDFKKIDVKRIIFGGQGDPFLYPKIMEAIKESKKNGIEVCLITGGAYLNEEKTKAIFDLGVDHIDVSLQAASEATYVSIHPSQREGTFERIKKQLILLAELKQKTRRNKPHVRLIHVVCNLNYQDAVKIVEIAKEVTADSVGFKRIDVMPETSSLLLNEAQLAQFKILLVEAEKRALDLGVKTEIDTFCEYMVEGLTTGIYTSDLYSRIPCYVGWHSSRILASGDVTPCCGCYNILFGNINNTSFIKIWNSQEYQKFRLEALKTNKNSFLKQDCKCYSCIDFGPNLGIYRKLHFLRFKSDL